MSSITTPGPAVSNCKLSNRDGGMGAECHKGKVKFKKYVTAMDTQNEQRIANTGHLGD